jgi:hypothetical protein
VSVTFDRPVSQFDCIPSGLCGLNVSAATARAVTFAVNPSLDRRTFLIGVTLLADGPVVLSIAPGAAHDVYDILENYGVGVSSVAATPFQWTHDATPPTVALSEVSLSSRHMIFRVEFSEDVVRWLVVGCRPCVPVSRLRAYGSGSSAASAELYERRQRNIHHRVDTSGLPVCWQKGGGCITSGK